MVNASPVPGGKFLLKVEKLGVVENVKANYLFIASGSSKQVAMHRFFIAF